MCTCSCLQASPAQGKQAAITGAQPAATQNGKHSPKPQQNGKTPIANGVSNGHTSAAERLKQDGNAAFKAGDYSGAVEAYGAAIELDPRNPVLFSNRAMASLKASSFIRLQCWTCSALAAYCARSDCYETEMSVCIRPLVRACPGLFQS